MIFLAGNLSGHIKREQRALDRHKPEFMGAFLALDQGELAKAAGVSLSTVQRWEMDKGEPMPANARSIISAIEAAGVEFIDRGVRRAPAR